MAKSRGGGFPQYRVRGAGETEPLAKIAYLGVYEPWQWIFQAGEYYDDIDGIVRARAIHTGTGAFVVLLLASAIAVVIARGLTRPIASLWGVMRTLAEGDTSLTVPHLDRRHEIGEIAGSIEVFRQRLADADRMRSEQDAEKARGAAEQKAALRRMAGAFEASIGSIVGAVASAATEMQTTPETISPTPQESNPQPLPASPPPPPAPPHRPTPP